MIGLYVIQKFDTDRSTQTSEKKCQERYPEILTRTNNSTVHCPIVRRFGKLVQCGSWLKKKTDGTGGR